MKTYQGGYTEDDRFVGCAICRTQDKHNGKVYDYSSYRRHIAQGHDFEEVVQTIIDNTIVFSKGKVPKEES